MDVGVRSEHGGLLRCSGCGLVRLAKSADAVNRSDYLGQDEEKIFPADRNRSFEVWSEFRLEQLLRAKPGIRSVAEVGSGTGHFLRAAMSRGIDAKGFDLADHRNCGKEAAFECASDPFSLLGGSSHDAVVAFHVLEHCSDPLGAVRAMLASLDSDGIGMLEIPGISENLPPLSAMIDPRHEWYFNQSTLRKLVEQAGGKVLGVERVGPTQAGLEAASAAGQKMTRAWGFLKAMLPAGCIDGLRKLARPQRDRVVRWMSSLQPSTGGANVPLNLCIFFKRNG